MAIKCTDGMSLQVNTTVHFLFIITLAA